MQHSLKERRIHARTITKPPAKVRLPRGSVTFLAAGPDTVHNDFITEAWIPNPLAAVLAGIDGPRIATPRARKP